MTGHRPGLSHARDDIDIRRDTRGDDVEAWKGVAGATVSAHSAADTSATNAAVLARFDRLDCGRTLAYLPMTALGHLTQATVPRRAQQTRRLRPPTPKGESSRLRSGPRAGRFPGATVRPRKSCPSPSEGPSSWWSRGQYGRLRWARRQVARGQRSVRAAYASSRSRASGRSVRPKPSRKWLPPEAELRARQQQHALAPRPGRRPSRRSATPGAVSRGNADRSAPRADPGEAVGPLLEEVVEAARLSATIRRDRARTRSRARSPMSASTSDGAEEQIVV